MKIKLASEELSVIAQIIEEFRSHDRDLNRADEQLQRLVVEKDRILKALRTTEQKELLLKSALRAKYGEGSLDLLTFDYITLEKTEEA